MDKGYIEENPMRKVRIDSKLFRPVRKKDSSTQVLMEHEEKDYKELAWERFKQRKHTKQPLTPLAVLFLLQTGLRIGELRALTYSDITDDGRHIVINKMIRNETGEIVDYTKGKYGDREVLLSDEAIRIIETAREFQKKKGASTEGYIFSMTETPIGYYAVNTASSEKNCLTICE